MGWLWTVSALVPLVGGAWCAAVGWFRTSRGWSTVLGAFVVGWTWLTLGVLAFGSLGWIAPGPFVGWSILGSALGLAGYPRRVREVLPANKPHAALDRLRPECFIAFGLSIWVLVTLGASSLVFPVKVVSDGPIYHLYFAARWWQAGRIFLVPTPFGENAAPYFPHVGEYAMTWLFTLWGSDRLAKLAQVPFLFMAAIAAYASARTLGAGRSASVVATLMFVTVTPFVLFTFEPNVDTLFVAGYLTAAYFFLQHALRGDDSTLILGGLASGAAWATKATGIVFIPVLLGATAIVLMARKSTFAAWARRIAVLFLTPLVFEGPHLIRNAWLTGNPLYPLRPTLGGVTLLDGWYGPEAMSTSPYYLPATDWRAFVDTLLSVFDPRLVPLWALAVLVGLARVGREPKRLGVALFSLGLIVNVALFWLVIPYRTQQRFLFHALGLGVVPLACLLGRVRWLGWLAIGLTGLHVLTAQAWPFPGIPWDLSPLIPNQTPAPAPWPRPRPNPTGSLDGWGMIAQVVPLACLASGYFWYRWSNTPRIRSGIAAVSLTVLLFATQVLLIQPEPSATPFLKFPPFRDYFAAWLRLDALTRRDPARIAYAGTNLPYYLMGSTFRNETHYVNVDEHRTWLPHDYHAAAWGRGQGVPWPDTRPCWDRLTPDFDAWLANLRGEGIRYLVVARANPREGPTNVADADGFTIERVWADSHPEIFAPVYGIAENDPWIKIYALRQAGRP